MLATRPIMHTEYLQPLDPLPTMLDAKKSPLALLAQTCSSIGKPDPPPNSSDLKSACTPIGRGPSPTGKRSPEKASTGVSHASFKPYKQAEKREGDALVIKIGYQAAKDKADKSSRLSASPPHSPLLKPKLEPVTTPRSSPRSVDISSDKDLSKSVPPVQTAQVAPSHIHHSAYPGHYKHGVLSASAPAGHCGCPSQVVGHVPYYADPAIAARDPLSFHKHEVNPLLAATASPYTAYARVKTADGGTTLMPICRDPYCTNCQTQSAQHYHQCSTPTGCTQCRHDPYAPFPIALPLPSSMSPYLTSGIPAGLHPQQYLFPHPPPPSTSSQENGHVCNWVSGATSCGKRFASSEELLQHLRTHTMTPSETPTPSVVSASLGAQLSAYYMQYPGAAFALPKPGFPSPLSPVATIRYHPYAKSPSPITSLPGLPTGAYYSPYALHDMKSRFATAGHPH